MHKSLRASVAMLIASPVLGAALFAGAASAQTVTIAGYVNGAPATASSTGSVSFPMTATWQDPHQNNGAAQSAQFSLSTSGFNNSNPYLATTNEMSTSSDYSASLNSQSWCSASYPFTPVGYSSGNSLQNAASASVSTTPPSFNNLQGAEYEIVWLRTCPSAPVLVSPTSGASLTSDQFTQATWDAVTDPATPISYYYEASNSSSVNSDGSLSSPVYESGALSSPTISTQNSAPGTYYWEVRAEDAAGNYSPWSSVSSVTVTSASTSTGSTGTSSTGVISGQVYNDANNNGTLDSDETGLANWPVFLAQGQQIIASSTTDSNGDYSFTNLAPGSYIVLSTYQQNYIPTAYPQEVQIGSNDESINAQNFGEWPTQTTTTPPQDYDNGANGSSGYGQGSTPSQGASTGPGCGYGFGGSSFPSNGSMPYGMGNGMPQTIGSSPFGFGNGSGIQQGMGQNPFGFGQPSQIGGFGLPMQQGINSMPGFSMGGYGMSSGSGMSAPMQFPFAGGMGGISFGQISRRHI